MATSGINFSGLISGMDTESLIQQIIQVESRRKTIWSNQQAQLTQRLSSLQALQAQLLGFQSAISQVTVQTAFKASRATSSVESVAQVSATADAMPGTYLLEVSQLATNHKIGTTAQSSADQALGLSGSFVVNGKQVTVVASDNLRDIAARINNAKAGVTASVFSVSSSEYYLVLTAQSSGAANAISLNDLGGDNVLQSLGLITAGTSIKNAITNGAQSDKFSDTTTAIGTLMALSNAPSGTIQINGVDIAIDLATDSLNSIVSKINSAGAGVTASVVTVNDNGTTRYRLQITGASTPTFTDDGHILETLGILKAGYGNELVQAKDAQFKIDNMSLTSSTNVLTNIIQGVTITLMDADATNPKRSTITITRDTKSIKDAIQGFVKAYNETIDLIKKYDYFDTETYETGPLFGNATVNALMSDLMGTVSNTVAGLSSDMSMLAQVGITLDPTGSGKLVLKESELDNALNNRLEDVERLFRVMGSTSDPRLTYVIATSKTKATGVPLTVEITQVATQARATATVAQTSASTTAERLTFSGTLFGSTEYSITLNAGNTIDDTIAQINADANLSRYLVASKDANGNLVLTSKMYGSKAAFTVVSDQEASSSNSGIGTTPISVQGQDVAGTINGEPATGDGQFLTGNSGNATTDGLQLRVTATTTGIIGTVTVTRGIADQMFQMIRRFTDSINGALTDETKNIQQQIDDIKARISAFDEAMQRRAEALRAQFTRMETALNKMRNDAMRLTAVLGQGSLLSNLGG
ncbi:MAG: flagellar filament capping protein FliD [Chthonomonadetes bacterium]|nr:flagellar filament capping protein FliD [Chthonomonadetes bacterium]